MSLRNGRKRIAELSSDDYIALEGSETSYRSSDKGNATLDEIVVTA
jgi:hypothetical protein